MTKPVRTRFAPSPTGPLHIGGIRTALFSWLWAKHNDGQFILRIEDTDQSRFVEGSLELIYQGLSWMGIHWDEGPDKGGQYGPYVQSERLEHYQQWANHLVDTGKAYKCFCTSERLQQVNDEKRENKQPPGYDRHCRDLSTDEVKAKEAEGIPYVIRLKMPLDGVTIAKDLLRDDIEFDNKLLQDIVILKSDGFPTYHFAHIVDDHMMEISHITRSAEWLPSLPTHVNIWDALGWDMPVYAHLPILLNPNGKGKLSKRSIAFDEDGKKVLVLAHEFIEEGYEPKAVANFLTNIGWNFGDEREVFSQAEAIDRFELAEVNAANSIYPIEKLEWLNGVYIREMDIEELAQKLKIELEKAGLEVNPDTLLQVTPLVQTRIKMYKDIVEMAGFFFQDYADFVAPDADTLIQRKTDAETTRVILERAIPILEALNDFSPDSQYQAMDELATELELKRGQVFGTLRAAVTGQQVSPPTFESMEVLGKDESLRRIHLAIKSLS